MDSAAQRMWTSALQLGVREFCSILNAVIRTDCLPAVEHAAVVVRATNKLCVVRRTVALRFPDGGICVRGGGLPDKFKAFFARIGLKYRVAGFLATSFNMDVARRFMYRAHVESDLPAVLWHVQLDPRGAESFEHRCKHVNFVEKTNVPGEEEFLFAPYSVFTVTKVEWSERPDERTPHKIFITAAVDNRHEPEDVPLAPWS